VAAGFEDGCLHFHILRRPLYRNGMAILEDESIRVTWGNKKPAAHGAAGLWNSGFEAEKGPFEISLSGGLELFLEALGQIDFRALEE